MSNSFKTHDNGQDICIHVNTHENTYWWSGTNHEPVWHVPTGSEMVPCLLGCLLSPFSDAGVHQANSIELSLSATRTFSHWHVNQQVAGADVVSNPLSARRGIPPRCTQHWFWGSGRSYLHIFQPETWRKEEGTASINNECWTLNWRQTGGVWH